MGRLQTSTASLPAFQTSNAPPSYCHTVCLEGATKATDTSSELTGDRRKKIICNMKRDISQSES